MLIGCKREELRVSEEVVNDSALIVGWEGERKEAAVLGGLFFFYDVINYQTIKKLLILLRG